MAPKLHKHISRNTLPLY